MTPLQIRVLAALPESTKSSFNTAQICRKVHDCECLAPAKDRVNVVINELLNLGMAERQFMNSGYRRTKSGDDSLAALQDLEAA